MDRAHGSGTRGRDSVPEGAKFEGRFGRMFWNLPVFKPSDERLLALADVMEFSGSENVENDKLPAGFTYLGQFIDHDITHDASSSLERVRDPEALVNFRTPRFDLDSLYGRGPVDSPFLYKRGTFELLSGSARGISQETGKLEPLPNQDDLPRNVEDVALIGDPRNDENTFVSQLHLLFIKFHNKVITDTASAGFEGDDLLKEAQRLVRWHYQRIVVQDYVRRIVSEDIFNSILTTDPRTGFSKIETLFYDLDREPYMPVEFSVAAFRFGHSQVRSTYKLNNVVDRPTFVPDSQLPSSEDDRRFVDFRGFRSLPEQWQPSWPHLFNFEDGTPPQMTNTIDTSLSLPLHKLPGEPEGKREKASLALRNLNRSVELSLPTGEWVARAMGVEPIDSKHTRGRTPLWFYVLEEAHIQQGGERLGEVGGRIVAEVLLGLLAGDPLSYIRVQPNWEPELKLDDGTAVDSMVNLIKYADPANGVRHSGISR